MRLSPQTTIHNRFRLVFIDSNTGQPFEFSSDLSRNVVEFDGVFQGRVAPGANTSITFYDDVNSAAFKAAQALLNRNLSSFSINIEMLDERDGSVTRTIQLPACSVTSLRHSSFDATESYSSLAGDYATIHLDISWAGMSVTYAD